MGIIRTSISDHEPEKIQWALCQVSDEGYIAVEMTDQLRIWFFFPIDTIFSEMVVSCQCRLNLSMHSQGSLIARLASQAVESTTQSLLLQIF